jgi:catechol 2,3-dioxygenase-like lactoylglutathione lyase family enzyme
MRVQQLDHLNMTVRDLEESAGWYGRVFGFERVEEGRTADGPWAILRSGDALLCIYEHAELGAPDEDAPSHHINHFGLRIDDREDWERTVEREGVEVAYGGAIRWPHSTAWYVTDPNGYEIEVALWDQNRVAFDRAPQRA